MVLRRCPLSQTVNKTIGCIMNCDFHTFILRVLRRCVPCELRRYHLVVLRMQVLGHKFNEYLINVDDANKQQNIAIQGVFSKMRSQWLLL